MCICMCMLFYMITHHSSSEESEESQECKEAGSKWTPFPLSLPPFASIFFLALYKSPRFLMLPISSKVMARLEAHEMNFAVLSQIISLMGFVSVSCVYLSNLQINHSQKWKSRNPFLLSFVLFSLMLRVVVTAHGHLSTQRQFSWVFVNHRSSHACMYCQNVFGGEIDGTWRRRIDTLVLSGREKGGGERVDMIRCAGGRFVALWVDWGW